MRVAWKSTNKALGICMVSVAFLLALLLVRDLLKGKEGERDVSTKEVFFPEGNRTLIMIASRKLLQYNDDDDERGDNNNNRIGRGCSKDDIVINQGEMEPLPSGIPAYSVQIMNMCGSDCKIGDIRVHCGWFSSASLVNPKVFRRIEYDDCLVNDGKPLEPGTTISFQYATTYLYPLSVSSVVCFSSDLE